MLEKLFNYSNELMELVLAEQPIPAELIRKVLRDATVHQLHGRCSAARRWTASACSRCWTRCRTTCPARSTCRRSKAIDPEKKADKKLIRKPDADEPFCGLVFKVLPAKHGDMHFVRVYSGTLKANSRVLNPGKDKKENVAQLWHIHADRREEQVRERRGRRHRRHHRPAAVDHRRHALRHRSDPILLESINFPETVISMAIEPESSRRAQEAGTTRWRCSSGRTRRFRASESEETGQTLISGMGELHLEIIKHRLLRDFNLNVKVHKPRVSYRETINAAGGGSRQMPAAGRRADAVRGVQGPRAARGVRQARRVSSRSG